ncbi:helix-turn-helix domain-containing protein [Anaerotruncus rubiinfantis]|uniref:helix-turn-helix domain-containing protein n=1 Tax=Anaerotruncus rubiinfantis TaxID=1720200 RepID=UPI000835911C|nr:helix-turn-helix transcriptional regulator [Anaerotruncus rubiinfantis]
MNTGNRIREARLTAGYTQKKLGELCNIAEPTIRRYELGKLNPKYGTLQKIALALEVSIDYLLGNTPYKTIAEEIKATAHMTQKKQVKAVRTYHPMEAQQILENELLFHFNRLNDQGQQKAAEYLADLTKVPDYQKK